MDGSKRSSEEVSTPSDKNSNRIWNVLWIVSHLPGCLLCIQMNVQCSTSPPPSHPTPWNDLIELWNCMWIINANHIPNAREHTLQNPSARRARSFTLMDAMDGRAVRWRKRCCISAHRNSIRAGRSNRRSHKVPTLLKTFIKFISSPSYLRPSSPSSPFTFKEYK